MIEPIKNSIIFQFVENTQRGRFLEESESGIYLGTDHQREAARPRWGTAIAVGPDVTDVVVGDLILIESSQWTYGTEYDGVKIWRTSEDKVLLVSEEQAG